MGDDDDDDHPLGSGLNSFLRLAGGVPARAQFVGEAILSGTLCSVTIGLGFGVVGAATFMGPLVPFLTGATVGYSFGLWKHWFYLKRTMQWDAHYYPTLLAHAMWTEHKQIVPKTVIQASKEQLRREEEETEGLLQEQEEKIRQSTMDNHNFVPLDQWVHQGNLARLTWAMLASQQCRRDIAAIEQQKRQRLVDDILRIDDDDDG